MLCFKFFLPFILPPTEIKSDLSALSNFSSYLANCAGVIFNSLFTKSSSPCLALSFCLQFADVVNTVSYCDIFFLSSSLSPIPNSFTFCWWDLICAFSASFAATTLSAANLAFLSI